MIQLSIILPTYNVSCYITRCLNSIISQGHSEDIEIILVDDESPDDSVKVAVDFAGKYPLKIVRQNNKGLGGARNTGLLNASGEYVWFVDPDDEIASGSLDCILSSLKDQDISIFDFVEKRNDGTVIGKSCSGEPFCNISGADADKIIQVSQAWRSVYRKAFLLENHIFFRERYLHEDGEFNMRVMCLAQKASFTPIVIYHYYTQNNGSIMNSIKLKNQQDLLLEFDTATNLNLEYPDLNENQKLVIQRHLGIALGVLFSNVLKLSPKDRKSFRELLKQYKDKIRSKYCYNNLSIKRKIILWTLINFPYFVVVNLVYNKKLF